jgi:hypothetical protein
VADSASVVSRERLSEASIEQERESKRCAGEPTGSDQGERVLSERRKLSTAERKKKSMGRWRKERKGRCDRDRVPGEKGNRHRKRGRIHFGFSVTEFV